MAVRLMGSTLSEENVRKVTTIEIDKESADIAKHRGCGSRR